MYDTFVVFCNENECDLFLHNLNLLHPFFHFAFEKESNLTLPFLDVLIRIALLIIVLHLYTNWFKLENAFCFLAAANFLLGFNYFAILFGQF